MKEKNIALLFFIILIIFSYVIILYFDYTNYDDQYSNFCEIKYNQSYFSSYKEIPFCIVVSNEGEDLKQYYFSKELADFYCPNKFLKIKDC